MKPYYAHINFLVPALLLVGGCADGPTTPQGPGPAAALSIVSGDWQTGTVGTRLPDPLVVRVTDAEGRPVPGQVLNFRVVSGGGSVFAGAAQTTSNGTAQELWTLGIVARDTQYVEVRAVDGTTGTPVVFATFRAIGTAAAPARLDRASADGLQGEVATAVSPAPRVRVADQYDNPVSGVTVTFTPTSGGGAVTGATQSTDANGYATVGAWTLGSTTAINTIAATTNALPSTSITFTAAAVPGAATQIVIDQLANGARAGTSFSQQPRLRLLDAHGNVVPTATQPVSISVNGGGTLLGISTVTPTGGVAVFQNAGVGGTVGSYDLTYHVTLGGVMRSVSQPITVSAGSAAKLSIQQPASGANGGLAFATQPVIRIVDAYSNLVTDAPLSVNARVSAGAAVIGDSAILSTAGVAQFSNVGLDARVGAYTLSFVTSINGETRSVTQPIAVALGTPVRYLMSSSNSSVEVGTPVTVTAQLADADGNAVSWAGETVTWSNTGSAGRFASATSTTDNTGVAMVTFTPDTIQTANNTIIVATDTRARTAADTVGVIPAPAFKLAFVSIPVNPGYGVRMSDVRVAVQDRYGNTRNSDVVQVEVALANNPGGGALSGTTSVQSAGGIATFNDLVLDRDGSGYSLTASSDGLLPATSGGFDVNPIGILGSTNDALFSLTQVMGNLYYQTRAGSLAPNNLMRLAPTGGTPTLFLTSGCCRGSISAIGDNTHLFLQTHNGSATSPQYGVSGMGFSYSAFGSLRGFDWDETHVYLAAGTQHVMETRLFRFQGSVRDTLLESQTPITGIRVYHDTIYFFHESAIKAMPAAGGTPRIVAANVTGGATMQIQNGVIYVMLSGTLSTVPTSGGVLQSRVTGIIDFGTMAIDGNSLYLQAGGVLRRYDLTTFAATTVIDAAEGLRGFALDDQSIYWTSNTSPVYPFGGTTIKKKRK